MYWVSFSAEFQCRGCGHRSPLNCLDLDGSVRCLRCGLDQAFATSAWQRALEHAHALGDLAGSDEGRQPHPIFSIADDNPYRDSTSATDQQSGFAMQHGMQVPTSVRSTATLGQPSCQACQVPLIISRTGPGRIETRCSRCAETRSYALPPEAPRVFPALVAVMAGEHRCDRPATRIASEAGAGAVALACPSCGAALDLAPGTRLATCAYCRTTSRVPDKTFYRGGSGDVQAETWWLAFDGPSATRKMLERDPDFPRNANDVGSADLLPEKPAKRKRPRPDELALVVGVPLLFLLAVAVVDLFILGGLELSLPF